MSYRFPLKTIKSILTAPKPSTVQVSGYIQSIRRLKAMSFLDIADGSCSSGIQAILVNYNEELTIGAAVKINGTLQTTRNNSWEIKIDNLAILSDYKKNEYPIAYSISREKLREIEHLRGKTRTLASIWRLRAHMNKGIQEFFETHEFIYSNPPILTSSDCEGGGESFALKGDFFNQTVYTTVSTQLHLEYLAQSLGRVYTIGPCFRAERSNTARHLAEFWMLESEVIGLSLPQLVDFIEALIKHVVRYCLKNSLDEITFLDKDGLKARLEIISNDTPYARMTYDEAMAKVSKKIDWKTPMTGFNTEQEKYLAEIMGPVFVTEYPSIEKSFYMKSQGDKALNVDLLLPNWGEVVGGSLREDNIANLEERMGTIKGLDWYKEVRRGGESAGFGMGIERLLGVISGVTNIRDLIPSPRSVGSCRN